MSFPLFIYCYIHRAPEGEITDCYSFSPKPWHNLSSSSLAMDAITCKAKYIKSILKM